MEWIAPQGGATNLRRAKCANDQLLHAIRQNAIFATIRGFVPFTVNALVKGGQVYSRKQLMFRTLPTRFAQDPLTNSAATAKHLLELRNVGIARLRRIASTLIAKAKA